MIKEMTGYAARMNVSLKDLSNTKVLVDAIKVLKQTNMVLFRGTEISRDQLRELARSIKKPAPMIKTYKNSADFISVISTKPGEGDPIVGQRGWHVDSSFTREIRRYAIIYARKSCPARNTIFVKNDYVLDEIPAERKEFWANLLVANTRNEDRVLVDDAPHMKVIDHDGFDPVIRFHEHYTRSFKDGKTGEELVGAQKEELIQEFVSYVQGAFDKNGYRHEYCDHDLILYKNSSMMHNFALRPEKKKADFRTLERVTFHEFNKNLKI